MTSGARLARSGLRRAGTLAARVAGRLRQPARSADDVVIVLGPPRSGTTLLLEALARPGALAVFEPLFPKHSRIPLPPETVDGFVHLGETEPASALARGLRRAAAGRGLTDWTLKAARPLDAGRAPVVMKEVRLNRAAGWLHHTFPRSATVLLVRHPVAIVSSMQEMTNATWQTWDQDTVQRLCAGFGAPGVLEEALAVRPDRLGWWATFAAVQLLDLVDRRQPDDSLLVDYETLRRDGPSAEMWEYTDLPAGQFDLERGSAMASAGSRDLPAAERADVLEIARILGIDFYGDDPEPDRESLHRRHARPLA